MIKLINSDKYNITLLYIEDDLLSRRLLEDKLRSYFAKVFIAKDGLEGLKLYKSEKPDLIILDVVMPNMGGIEFIKNIESDRKCKIIITSAFSDSNKLIELINLGIDYFITKPINFEKLKEAIDKLFYNLLLEQNINIYMDKLVKTISKRTIELNNQRLELIETKNILADKEKRYSDILNHSYDGIYINKDNKFLFANITLCQQLGYTETEIYTLNIWDLIHPDDKQRIIDYGIKRTSGEDVPNTYISRVLTKSGVIKICEFAVKTIQYENDWAVLGIVKDITDKIIAKEKLVQSERKFNKYLKSSPIAIIIAKKNGNIQFVNTAACLLLKYSETEILRMKIIDLVPQEYIIKGMRSFLQVLENKNIRHDDFQLKRKNNEHVDIILDAVKLNDNEIMAYCVDVTELIKIESKLEESLNTVSAKNKELEQFSYVATHDLRSPILNLKGLLDVFRKQNFITEENKPIIERIIKTSDNLYTTLHDLISVITTVNNADDNIRIVDFEQTVLEVLTNFEDQIKLNKIKVHYNFKKVSEICYYPTHVKSVIQNLITNAIKYRSNKRSLVINIYACKRNNMVELCVQDNGMGILPEHKEKIFQLFKKVNFNSEGKGIGLFLVKSLLESNGGSIEVDSEYDKRTIFTVSFKLK